MAIAGGGGGGGAPPDILWSFPGQLSADQNPNLYTYVAEKALSFIGFSANLNVFATGQDVKINWLFNGLVVATLTVPVGQKYAFLAFPLSLAGGTPGDTLQPQIQQVGTLQPGLTMVLKARGT